MNKTEDPQNQISSGSVDPFTMSVYKKVTLCLIERSTRQGFNSCLLMQKKSSSSRTPLIGVTGFEPATSRPPAERATKLRHTPCQIIIAKETAFEKTIFKNSFFTKTEPIF